MTMQTKVIKITDPKESVSELKEAARVLREGGLVVFPTETVYGLGGDGTKFFDGKFLAYNNNDDTDSELMCMYVWVNGEKVEYNLNLVDSITFAPKEGIVVKAKVPTTWTDQIYVWIWGDDVTTNEFKANKQGDWYVFTHYGKELNIIFKNGK